MNEPQDFSGIVWIRSELSRLFLTWNKYPRIIYSSTTQRYTGITLLCKFRSGYNDIRENLWILVRSSIIKCVIAPSPAQQNNQIFFSIDKAAQNFKTRRLLIRVSVNCLHFNLNS